MRQGRLPVQIRPAQVLGLAAALMLAGCITNDPHPASPSTPGDPEHPPSASIHDRDISEPVQSDVVNRPATLDANPYVQNTEQSK